MMSLPTVIFHLTLYKMVFDNNKFQTSLLVRIHYFSQNNYSMPDKCSEKMSQSITEAECSTDSLNLKVYIHPHGMFAVISRLVYTSLEITVGHHLWKSIFEYNFQLYSWKLYSKTLFHRWCPTVISRYLSNIEATNFLTEKCFHSVIMILFVDIGTRIGKTYIGDKQNLQGWK